MKSSYNDLIVWQKAIHLVQTIYQITMTFPAEEKYGLTSQLRRSSISVPSNIAEGSCRESPREFMRFLKIALASLSEVETQIIISVNLGFMQRNSALEGELASIMRMLRKLIHSLQSHNQ